MKIIKLLSESVNVAINELFQDKQKEKVSVQLFISSNLLSAVYWIVYTIVSKQKNSFKKRGIKMVEVIACVRTETICNDDKLCRLHLVCIHK